MNEIKGIIPPLVTPLLDEDTLDVEGLEQLVEHVIAGGVHGLFILGTTGEGPSLKYDLRVELIEKVCDQVDRRVPILVGITDASFRQAVHVANAAREAEAQAAVLAPPFYYQIRPDELYDFVDRLIDETDLPLFLYDNPGLTGVKFELGTIRELVKRPEVIGFKDSSADAKRFHQLKELFDESNIPLLVGPEELLTESLIMGADGGVPGGANVFPELYVSLYDKVRAGSVEDALDRHRRILEVSSVVYSGTAYGSSSVINGIKAALASMDICNDYVAKPLSEAPYDKREEIEKFVSRERNRRKEKKGSLSRGG